MPLTTCPDCGQQISSEAAACPSCGRPAPQTAARSALQNELLGTGAKGCSGCFFVIGILLLALALLILHSLFRH